MGFNISFGGSTFNLELSSSEIDTSLVSTKFIKDTNSCDQRDRDAVIELIGFTGKLYISHPDKSDESDVVERNEEVLDTGNPHKYNENEENQNVTSIKKSSTSGKEDANMNTVDFYTVKENKVSMNSDFHTCKNFEAKHKAAVLSDYPTTKMALAVEDKIRPLPLD